MKVWLLLSRFEVGGLERVQSILASGFHDAGLDVSIVAGRITEEGRTQLPRGIPIIEVARGGARHFPMGLWMTMRLHRPDVIFATSSDIACLTLLFQRMLLPDLKVVYTEHLALPDPTSLSGLRRLKRHLLQMAMRRLYPNAAAGVAVSAGVAGDVAQLVGRGNCRVIYNPTLSAASASIGTATLPWADDGVPVIAWAGRMEAVKRLDLLVEAFLLIANVRKLRLVLVGGGALGESLRECLVGRADIFLAGVKPDPFPYFRAASVVVLSSDAEGFGNVLVEAMACGTQVIATDCPHGPAEILEGGRYGQLVPRGDVAALAAAIIRAVDRQVWIDPQTLKRRSKDFGAGKAVEAYLQLIREITTQSTSQ